MSFFSKLFGNNSPKIECPRCLGKGHVSFDDIKRLKRELKWLPGSCAYCHGTGKVKAETPGKIPADTSYLTVETPGHEARKLLQGDKSALEKARQVDLEIDEFIKRIEDFYFKDKYDVEQIANHFYAMYPNVYTTDKVKKELTDYITKVIETRDTKNGI